MARTLADAISPSTKPSRELIAAAVAVVVMVEDAVVVVVVTAAVVAAVTATTIVMSVNHAGKTLGHGLHGFIRIYPCNPWRS